jgi:hypothetical protein
MVLDEQAASSGDSAGIELRFGKDIQDGATYGGRVVDLNIYE